MGAGSKEKTIGKGLTMRKRQLVILAAAISGCTVFGGFQLYAMGSNESKNPVSDKGVCGDDCKNREQEEETPSGTAPALPESATTQEIAREALAAINGLWRLIEENASRLNAELQQLQTCSGNQTPVDPTVFLEPFVPIHATIDRAARASVDLMAWGVQECGATTCLPYHWIADNFETNYRRRFPSVPIPQTPPTMEAMPLQEFSPLIAQSIARALAEFEGEFLGVEAFYHVLSVTLTPEYVVTPATFVESIRILDDLASALEAMADVVGGLIVEHCPELAPLFANENCSLFCETEIKSFCSETKRDTTDADTDGSVTPDLKTDCLFCGPRGL